MDKADMILNLGSQYLILRGHYIDNNEPRSLLLERAFHRAAISKIHSVLLFFPWRNLSIYERSCISPE